MSHAEIIAAIRQMPPAERLALIETVLTMTRADLLQRPAPNQADQQMQAAALALREDYEQDQDLTSFTALDGVDFYGEGCNPIGQSCPYSRSGNQQDTARFDSERRFGRHFAAQSNCS